MTYFTSDLHFGHKNTDIAEIKQLLNQNIGACRAEETEHALHYLAVYRQSSKDGYRVNVRQKKDADKIRFIESKL